MTDMEKVIKGLEEISNDKWMKTHADWYASVCSDALALLKEQPEIVRCKDCKHFDGIDCRVNDIVNIMNTDWYCADGERKEVK